MEQACFVVRLTSTHVPSCLKHAYCSRNRKVQNNMGTISFNLEYKFFSSWDLARLLLVQDHISAYTRSRLSHIVNCTEHEFTTLCRGNCWGWLLRGVLPEGRINSKRDFLGFHCCDTYPTQGGYKGEVSRQRPGKGGGTDSCPTSHLCLVWYFSFDSWEPPA